MTGKLTAKQQLFIKEYLIDLNATQAAIRAGYNPKTAYSQGQRLLKNVEIAEAIKKAMDARAEKVDISAEWVLKGFQEIYEFCVQKKTRDNSNANRALENIGKHLGILAEYHKHELFGKGGGPIEIIDTSKWKTKYFERYFEGRLQATRVINRG